jgi:dTDP-4-amino-4,6-dideoxygalactose transaminase
VNVLPVSRPSLGDEELIRLKEVLESGWLGQGAAVAEFEDRLGEMMEGRHVVAVNTGTSALHLALEALGVGSGDEVIVPSLTFCASVQAITALGAAPVFCEVDPRTFCIDPADARRRVTSRTRALMPVHYGGSACDMDALLALAGEHGLRVVEDAAHAFGSTYRGRGVGSFGDVTCFSFDPIKNITCGEGGAIVVSDAGLAELLRRKRMLGIDRDRWQRRDDARSWSYAVSTQGYRYHMSNLNAAIGLAQLSKLARFRARRREISRAYDRAFAALPGLCLLDCDLDACCPFAYTLRVREGRRDALRAHLEAAGVGTGINYIPSHYHPHFAAYATPLPVTERLFEEMLSIPLYCDMTDDDVTRVAEAVAEFFSPAPAPRPMEEQEECTPCP